MSPRPRPEETVADGHGSARSRPALSRAAIIHSALSIIDRDGLEALTMRRLGRELQVDPMAIYYYLPSKSALFDGIVEAVYDEIDLDSVSPAEPWPDQLASGMRSFRAALRRHPNAIPAVGTRPANTPRMIEITEAGVALLVAAGVPAPDAIDALTCLTIFTIGHALAEVGQPVGGQANDSEPETAARPEIPSGSVLAGYEYSPDTQYELGLGAMLDGLSARLGLGASSR
jgi:AcrR family transcriptional regulator